MTAWLAPVIELATTICGLIATEEANKYIQELKQAEMDLVSEDAKGDDADDGKIEFLHKQISITLQAINQQYALSRAPK